MKGHWSTDDSLTRITNRQQQRLIVQEQRCSPRSTIITSAWDDGIVTEEPMKDSDFGVSSSSRYAPHDSLWNGHSSSTTDCSLSPTSEYSPRPVSNDYTVSAEFTAHRNILNEYRLNRSISDVVRLSSVDINVVRNALQCPMCIFNTSNRLEFTDHLIACCALRHDDADPTRAVLAPCFPNRATERPPREDDSSPTLQQRAGQETEKTDQSTIDDLGIDWQGDARKQRIKGFREGKCCKQCSYIATTKMEYWEHMRCHIKGFTCPECSFVTKYKHHMNHHWLSVHDGSKPFKCKKCSYTCVSKSMLTSHLKKHSNVYPYRCANCTYKTKFCNALKKHLRKKGHQPAMVLNADGSPNPLSIIDVYGTKRGPKQKSCEKKWNQNSGRDVDVTTTSDDQPRSAGPISPVSSLESPDTAAYLTAITDDGTTNDAAGTDQNAMNQINRQSTMTFPYSDLVAAFDLSGHLLFRDDLQETTDDYAQRSDLSFGFTSKTNCKLEDLTVPGSFVQNLAMADDNAKSDGKSDICANVTDPTEESSTFVTSKHSFQAHKGESTNTPLDLRKTEMIGNERIWQLEPSIIDLSRTISTNRRKGKAIKLERRLLEERVDEKQPVSYAESSVSATVDEEYAVQTRNKTEHEKIKEAVREGIVVNSTDNRLICHYCEIAFGDAAMYSVHMGYHGFSDPYTCNMCGHRCVDRLSFFLHIGRSKHT